jgi:sulfite oxidase
VSTAVTTPAQADTEADCLVHHSESPLCAGPEGPQLVEQFVTPTELHFVRNHGPVPRIDRGTYRLRIDGLVEHQLELGFHELVERFELHEQTVTLQCAGNRRTELNALRAMPGEVLWGGDAIATATWRGVRLVSLLFAAGVAGAASHVWFEGLDSAVTPTGSTPFGSSITVARALRPDVLIAVAMNGEPLAPDHGAPARVVIPGVIGARSVKWLGRVTLADGPSPNHFQANGYRIVDAVSGEAGPPLEEVALNAFIVAPGDGAGVVSGSVGFQGYATPSGGAAVADVQLQLDGGTWQRVRLVDQPRPATWVRWQAALVLTPGTHRIRVRAMDTQGAQQPPDVRALWNPRGYGNNAIQTIEVTAR